MPPCPLASFLKVALSITLMQHFNSVATAVAPPLCLAPTRAGWWHLRPVLLLALAATWVHATTIYHYTGGVQTYTVPVNVAAGQAVTTGGSSGYDITGSRSLGAVARARGPVTPGAVLTMGMISHGHKG
jgi:hypothetical protein